jgi:5-methylcytosine-specific restriction endonuclease McrA
MDMDEELRCNICHRKFNTHQGRFPVGPPTKHHVIPKQKYRRRWIDAEVVLICKSCHRQINKFFTNNELKRMSIEELTNHPKVIQWITWIRKE